jgi:hypothetical protein
MSKIISAKQVRRKAKGDGFIQDYIKDILLAWQDDVTNTSDQRLSCARTKLPTDFDIPTMEPYDAQRAVYYYLCKKIEDKGFIPSLVFQGHRVEEQQVWLETRWKTIDDEKAQKHMDDYLKSRTRYMDMPGEEQVVTHRRRRRRRNKSAKPPRERGRPSYRDDNVESEIEDDELSVVIFN